MAESEKQPDCAFLIEEYKNIAATHDGLREVLARLFNYFLLLSAFPFTVAGLVFRNGGFNLFAAPGEIRSLFALVGVGDLCLALALFDARLSQYRYARTVNAIRRYFNDSVPEIKAYLYLPTSSEIPSWSHLGFVGPQLFFMVAAGAGFIGLSVYGVRSVCLAVTCMVVYVGLYAALHLRTIRRYREHKGIK